MFYKKINVWIFVKNFRSVDCVCPIYFKKPQFYLVYRNNFEHLFKFLEHYIILIQLQFIYFIYMSLSIKWLHLLYTNIYNTIYDFLFQS